MQPRGDALAFPWEPVGALFEMQTQALTEK
jgi:hypothetical protein